METRKILLHEAQFYHIFNRGVNSKTVFINSENYRFFLEKTEKYILPFFDVYAYCLMPNHFHFILKTKEIDSLKDLNRIALDDRGLHSENSIFSKSIAKLISSYTQAFNKVYQRTGALFESPFKRILIDSEEYLRNLIIYIHQNPENFETYRFSSYQAIILNTKTAIKKDEVLEIFYDKANFIESHRKQINI